MTLAILNGTLVDPKNKIHEKKNLYIEDGKVRDVTDLVPQADRVLDAEGKIVSPGFIDIHMHEDEVLPDGTIDTNDETAIFNCMLRQGVTTAVAGNCGENRYDPAEYLDLIDRQGLATNVAMLAGHEYIRNRCSTADKYSPVSDEELSRMVKLTHELLERGCWGLSYGIRYVPGIDERELEMTAACATKDDRMVASHIRDDAAHVFDAADEFLTVMRDLELNAEVSHIGSMAGFGQMEEFLEQMERYRKSGLRVDCDCYPYDAFCTDIGSTTYDDGWLERYQCGYDVVEPCEGKYKKQRLTEESFFEVRREHPEYLSVAHVMRPEEVEMALCSDHVMIGSDGSMHRGQGHPRAAGAFPHFLAEYVRTGKLTLDEAVLRMSVLQAEKLGLSAKGHLGIGADADLVIFDPDTVCDRSSFDDPIKPPVGIDFVVVNGIVAAEGQQIVCKTAGKALRP